MRYSPIFTIEIEHDYFSETLPNVLRIIPTAHTENVLRGAGLIAKFFQNKLYVLVRHLEDDTPLLKLDDTIKLQFFLEVVGFEFDGITNYSSKDPYETKLYFSNANSIIDGNDKEVENVLYLNEKLPQFNAANAYNYNDLVRSGSDTAYECLKNIAPNTGNLNNSSQFRQLDKVSYVSARSSLRFTGPEKRLILETPDKAVEIKYYAYNVVTKQFDLAIKNTSIGINENPTNIDLDSVLLNFYSSENSPFAEGIYRVTVNAQEEFFYFRLENDWRPYLGLITIQNNTQITEEKYRFLKGDGSFFTIPPDNDLIATRDFKIRYAPAQYLIKYRCKTNKVTNISDDDGNIEFDNLGSNVFQSKLPVRMSERSIDTISITYDGSQDLKKTKVPDHKDLSMTNDGNKYIISETFLNL